MTSLAKDLPPLPEALPTEDAQKAQPGVFRRLTSKLRSPSQSWAHVSSSQAGLDQEDVPGDQPSHPSTKKEKPKRKVSAPLLSQRKAGYQLENAFTSPEQRQAALRAAGLVPSNTRPGKDAHGYNVPLSELEEQLDRRYAITPENAPRSSGEQESEAQRIKEAWMKKNSEGGGAEGCSISSGTRATSRSPERVRRSYETPGPEVIEPQELAIVEQSKLATVEQTGRTEPRVLMTSDQVRARRKDDPVFAPSGLLAAMQAYKPENYRPPPGRIPSGPPKAQHHQHNRSAISDSDDSD